MKLFYWTFTDQDTKEKTVNAYKEKELLTYVGRIRHMKNGVLRVEDKRNHALSIGGTIKQAKELLKSTQE